MALHLVVDPTRRPADFGRAAAVFARRHGARFMHMAARFDLSGQPDAAQYVYAAGGLGPSGLHLVERIIGEPVASAAGAEAIVEAARLLDVVVPIHPAFGQDEASLRRVAEQSGVGVSVGCPDDDREASARPEAAPSSCRICLVGREADHRDVYPAALASLHAAADALGFDIAVGFNDPQQLDEQLLRDVAGILLPGGSDMRNVPGQIAAASVGIARGIPVLGLCLGMQTMTTAFARHALGDAAIALAEADDAAATKSFVAMADVDAASLPAHRTGDATVELLPGSKLAAIMAAATMRIRCNHKFHLSPALRPALSAAGLVVGASSYGDRVADAVEWPQHRFFIGLQGHPELTLVDGGPHPVFAAFLQAVRAMSGGSSL